MGRKKSDYECPKCGKIGFLRNNPFAVVHYDHATGRIRTCYIKRLMDERNRDHVSAEDPPKEFCGESDLYHKLGNMANHFIRIGEQLEKIQMEVYKFRPDARTSTQCVKDLEIFEKGFLNPVERLLIPYHDKRWATNWTDWFKIQIDSFKYGSRAAGMMNAIPTGQHLMEVMKDKEGMIEKDNACVIIFPAVREFTGSQVKKNRPKTLKFAYELLCSHPLEKALNNWAKNNNE